MKHFFRHIKNKKEKLKDNLSMIISIDREKSIRKNPISIGDFKNVSTN